MWVSIVVVSIRVRFFVFGGSGKIDIVRICCNGVFCFCGEFDNIFGNTSKFFCFSYSQCKDELYSLFCHIFCNMGISDIFDLSIYMFDH